MIDDDENDAFMIKRMFSKEGAPVEVAHRADAIAICDNVELIKLSEEGPESYPDFIFLDLNMPGFDGFSLLRQLKANDKIRRIPVFIMTTSEIQENVDLAYEYGAAGYFVKPATVDAYRQLVQSFVQFWCGPVRLPLVRY